MQWGGGGDTVAHEEYIYKSDYTQRMFRPEHITLERTLISLWLTQKEATQYGGKGDTGMLDK